MNEDLARQVLEAARARGVMIATAESCTGGMVATALTDIAGSSDVFDRGFVTYSYAAKNDLLSVPHAIIAHHGAVSEAVAKAMAEGALRSADAEVTVAITGIAGPGGGTAHKPVGLVWFATAVRGEETRSAERRFGDLGRAGVRAAATETALQLLLERLS